MKALTEFPQDKQPLSMMEWWDSEGGRKCICCMRYRKATDLFVVGHPDCGHHTMGREDGTVIARVSISAQPICGKCIQGSTTEGE